MPKIMKVGTRQTYSNNFAAVFIAFMRSVSHCKNRGTCMHITS